MGSRPDRQGIDEQIAHIIQLKAAKLAATDESRDCEAADFEQILSDHWLQSRRQFRPDCGDIITFADIVLNRCAANIVASLHAAKRDVRLCTVSLDDCIEDEDGTPMSRHEIYDPDRYFRALGSPEQGDATRDDLRIDLGRVLRSLTPKQRELCDRLPFQEVTEIAKEMGIARETVYAWERRIRSIFERAGLAIYLRPESASDAEDFTEKDDSTT